MRIPLTDLPDRIAFCDPSGGRTVVKKTKARSAIVVVTQDWIERIYLLFAWADHCSTDKLYDKIFWVHEIFGPNIFGFEANAMQGPFADGIRREARIKGVRLHLQDVWQPTNIQKPFRNRAALQKPFYDYRFRMQEDQVEAYHELATHPMNPLCDIVDAIASAVALLPKRTAAVQQDTDELVYARLLRRQGVTSREIEFKLAERRQRRSNLKGGQAPCQQSPLQGSSFSTV